MKSNQSNVEAILNASTVTYVPVSAREKGCLAVFRAAAHFCYLAGTSAEERAAMGYQSNDWNEFFDPNNCPTRAAAREAGFKTACAMLG